MKFEKTPLEGLVEITPDKFYDSRGYFFEAYNYEKFRDGGIDKKFVQDNQAFSPKGVLRGMHLQLAPHAQAKLVRILAGKVIDAVIDLRKNSPTFGQSHMVVMDAESQKMLYIPEGFAHGYLTLEDTLFLYKCSDFYNKESESGLIWNDPEVGLEWNINTPLMSEKDLKLPTFVEFTQKYL